MRLGRHLLPAHYGKVVTVEQHLSGPPALQRSKPPWHISTRKKSATQTEGAGATEQRETLDGCKLLHHSRRDVDYGLEVRSFTAHERLVRKIISLIHDTFGVTTKRRRPSCNPTPRIPCSGQVRDCEQHAVAWVAPSAPVYTDIPRKQGCKVRCSFCFRNQLWSWRVLKPDQVADMVEIFWKTLAVSSGRMKEE
jgi:hypothetical protein